MAHVVVGRWGKTLAIRVPTAIAQAAGLSDGEDVEIETLGSDILIRRSAAGVPTPAQAEIAAAEIIADGKGRSLGGTTLRALRDDGRR